MVTYTPEQQEAVDAVSFYGSKLNAEDVDGVVSAYAPDGIFIPTTYQRQVVVMPSRNPTRTFSK